MPTAAAQQLPAYLALGKQPQPASQPLLPSRRHTPAPGLRSRPGRHPPESPPAPAGPPMACAAAPRAWGCIAAQSAGCAGCTVAGCPPHPPPPPPMSPPAAGRQPQGVWPHLQPFPQQQCMAAQPAAQCMAAQLAALEVWTCSCSQPADLCQPPPHLAAAASGLLIGPQLLIIII